MLLFFLRFVLDNIIGFANYLECSFILPRLKRYHGE